MSAPNYGPYQWLESVVGLPRMLQVGFTLYGTHETLGEEDNPTILSWASELGLRSYTHDSIAWCGLFMAIVAKRAGKTVPDAPLWALNWARWGVPSLTPSLGDVLVFQRPGGGHVGLYVGEDDDAYHVYAGNQKDQVGFARILKSRCRAVREPGYRIRPLGAKPVYLKPEGEVSTDES